MTTQLSESALIGAVQDVLERMCFVSLISETQSFQESDAGIVLFSSAWQDSSERGRGKQVTFTGTLCGIVRFWFERPLATALTANLLGLEVTSIEEGDVSDALGEIANMVCGVMLGTLEAKHSFALRTPVDAGHPKPGDSSTCLFHTEEGLLLSSLSFGDVGQ